MYHGKYPVRSRGVPQGSTFGSPFHRPIKRRLGDVEDDLSEVPVNVYPRYVANSAYPPNEYDIPEIVVEGNRIPWWAWGIAGALAVTALTAFVKR